MGYRFFSAALVVLLAGTLLTGQCVACWMAVPAPSGHDCCSHPQSTHSKTTKQCPGPAVALHDTNAQAHFNPVIAVVLPVIPAALVESVRPADTRVANFGPPSASPPELYLFHATLLI